MGPQRPSTDQTGIRPDQGLLQGTPVTFSTKLSRTSPRWGQAAIEADGQHQPNRGALWLQAVN